MLVAGLAFVLLAAAGTLVRAEIGWTVNRPGRWPWGTFAVNLLAAAGLGLVVGSAGGDTSGWSAGTVALAVGGLGALGTVSGLAAEVVGLAEGGRRRLAVGYLLATLTAGVAAAWAGLALTG